MRNGARSLHPEAKPPTLKPDILPLPLTNNRRLETKGGVIYAMDHSESSFPCGLLSQLTPGYYPLLLGLTFSLLCLMAVCRSAPLKVPLLSLISTNMIIKLHKRTSTACTPYRVEKDKMISVLHSVHIKSPSAYRSTGPGC